VDILQGAQANHLSRRSKTDCLMTLPELLSGTLNLNGRFCFFGLCGKVHAQSRMRQYAYAASRDHVLAKFALDVMKDLVIFQSNKHQPFYLPYSKLY
jgi:hypothetical protein